MAEPLQAFPDSRPGVSDHAAFIHSGVAIDVATRDSDGMPYVTIGCGCRATPRRNRVTVLIQRDYSKPVLAALAASGVIAVTFGRPSTHESLQLKGTDAIIGAVGPRDRAVFTAYQAAFIADMVQTGFAPELAAAYIGNSRDLVTVSFTPTAAFKQTPGPDAGIRLA